MMPQTWRGTYGADQEYVAELRRTADARRDLEERHPELAGDRRPIIAHEGRYEHAPLRAGESRGGTDGGSAAGRGSDVLNPSELAAALRRAGVRDVDASSRSRAEYSSDASLYRVPPAAVVFPATRRRSPPPSRSAAPKGCR
ncbi:hypothetical protein ACFQX6_26440 [Streptosporangium lutulentum]